MTSKGNIAILILIAVVVFIASRMPPYDHACAIGDAAGCKAAIESVHEYDTQKSMLLKYRLATGKDLK